ncbi:8694_t:CDS:2 [Funneliformis caledonium]|uniref:8694_t:CDS:1 n=2 Tax=Funneliformis TaxID=1117308 RepID=A0A9N8YN12_9GLOM|nr:8694_t:CDS:2 [Funneliformis caledonium]
MSLLLGTKGIFGIGLSDGIEYASVPICMAGADGQQYVYGYIPTIVAKCGMYLKEKATTTEGIFRLSGSAKRIKELQAVFDSPPLYGKSLTWMGYSVHDAANILRRYLNHLPDPVIPQQWYDQFRSVHGQNLMPSKNLASIFQPGILSHPSHDMAPEQYKLSQEVLEFLIDYQNYFLMSLPSSTSNDVTEEKTTTLNNNGSQEGKELSKDTEGYYRGIDRESCSISLQEPHDLNNLPVPQLSLRRSSLSLEHRNKSADSITMIPGVINEQDTNEDLQLTKRVQGQDPLTRKITTDGLTRRRTLPSKKSKYGVTRERATSTIGSSNAQFASLINLPKENNNNNYQQQQSKERKTSQFSRKKSSSKRTRNNRSGTSGNIEPVNASINSSSSSMKGGPSSTKSLSSQKSPSLSTLNGKKKLVDVVSDEKENASITSSSSSFIAKRRKRNDKKGKGAQEAQGRKEKMTFLLELRRKMWFGGSNSSGGNSEDSILSVETVNGKNNGGKKTFE